MTFQQSREAPMILPLAKWRKSKWPSFQSNLTKIILVSTIEVEKQLYRLVATSRPNTSKLLLTIVMKSRLAYFQKDVTKMALGFKTLWKAWWMSSLTLPKDRWTKKAIFKIRKRGKIISHPMTSTSTDTTCCVRIPATWLTILRMKQLRTST